MIVLPINRVIFLNKLHSKLALEPLKMAPVYKLKYFNYMGLVEPIRYLLAYGNIEYENIVVPDAEWTKLQKGKCFHKYTFQAVQIKAPIHISPSSLILYIRLLFVALSI